MTFKSERWRSIKHPINILERSTTHARIAFQNFFIFTALFTTCGNHTDTLYCIEAWLRLGLPQFRDDPSIFLALEADIRLLRKAEPWNKTVNAEEGENVD